MWKRRIVWAACVLAALVMYLFDNNGGTRAMLVVAALLPLLVAAGPLLFKPRLTAELEVPELLERGESEPCTLILKSSGGFPLVWVRCELEIVSRLTGERGTVEVSVGLTTGDEARTPIKLTVAHCGAVTVRTIDTRVMDPFGLFARKVPCEAEAKSVVHPTVRPVQVVSAQEGDALEDSSRYSTQRAGNDPSETFQIRDYAPGDPIRRIHWKLTEKLDKPLVRDFGLPREARMMLTLEAAQVSWNDTDKALDDLFSVGRALYRQEMPCTVRWTTAEGPQSRTLYEPEDWDEFQSQLMDTRLSPVRFRMDGVELVTDQ